MEQLTKNQAVATSQEAVQNQNEPQLRDENAHNDKSVHGVLNPTYQAGLRRDAVQPDIEAERKKRDEIEAGKSYCSRRFGGATCDVTLIILTLSVSRLLNLLLRLVAFLLFLNPQCLASISRWITASSSWKRFCLFVCRALSSIMVICMLTAIRLLLTFVMSLYLLLRS